jgi:hypothetical protein
MKDFVFTGHIGAGISVTAEVGGPGAQAAFTLFDKSVSPQVDLGPAAVVGPSSSRWDLSWATIVGKGWNAAGASFHLQTVLLAPAGQNLSVYVTVSQPEGAGQPPIPATDISTAPPTNLAIPVLMGNGTTPNFVHSPFLVNFVQGVRS